MTRSTVTTEAIAGVADLKAGYTLGHADVAILKEISAELLAVRVVQPVVNGVCLRGVSKDQALAICSVIELVTGSKIDWLYIDGNLNIKALTPPAQTVPGYKLDGLNIRAVAALRSACSDQWLKSEEFADKVHWQNMHSIANEIMEAMAAAPTK